MSDMFAEKKPNTRLNVEEIKAKMLAVKEETDIKKMLKELMITTEIEELKKTGGPPTGERHTNAQIWKRQFKVMRFTARGIPIPEIARMLHCNERTIERDIAEAQRLGDSLDDYINKRSQLENQFNEVVREAWLLYSGAEDTQKPNILEKITMAIKEKAHMLGFGKADNEVNVTMGFMDFVKKHAVEKEKVEGKDKAVDAQVVGEKKEEEPLL